MIILTIKECLKNLSHTNLQKRIRKYLRHPVFKQIHVPRIIGLLLSEGVKMQMRGKGEVQSGSPAAEAQKGGPQNQGISSLR